jgi:hypothetical protein
VCVRVHGVTKFSRPARPQPPLLNLVLKYRESFISEKIEKVLDFLIFQKTFRDGLAGASLFLL